MFDNKEDDQKQDDFFEKIVEEEPPKPKAPVIPPSDPRYWEQEESPWEHLRGFWPSNRKLLLIGGAVIVALLLFLGLKFIFGTYEEECVEYGYVDTIQRRGEYIKTYEGSLIRYREIHDTTRVYTTDFIFSTPDAQGRLLQRFLGSGRPVKVTYKVYNCVLPWRGERREVVMRVDTISPDSILPPEFDARAYAHPAVGDTIYKTN